MRTIQPKIPRVPGGKSDGKEILGIPHEVVLFFSRKSQNLLYVHLHPFECAPFFQKAFHQKVIAF